MLHYRFCVIFTLFRYVNDKLAVIVYGEVYDLMLTTCLSTVKSGVKGAGHDGSFVCINVGAHTVDVSP